MNRARRRHPLGAQAGVAFVVVLLILLIVALVGVGVLSVVMSDLHGAVANKLAVQAVDIAEAGVDFAVGWMYQGWLNNDPANSLGYGGPAGDCFVISFSPRSTGCSTAADIPPGEPILGTFRVDVKCVLANGTPGADPDPVTGCPDDPDPSEDESNLRLITSDGFITQPPPSGAAARARRQIQVWIRRGVTNDVAAGLCGRNGVTLDRGAMVTANVASNRDISVQGPAGMGNYARILTRPKPGPTDTPIAGPDVSTDLATRLIGPAPGYPGLNGSYSWKVTFVNELGGESDATYSQSSSQVALNNQYLRFRLNPSSDIPLGPTSLTEPRDNIVKVRLYRTKANSSGPFYFVREIDKASMPDYITDWEPDSALLGPPPSAPVAGNAFAGADVACSRPPGCGDGDSGTTQVDGLVTENLQDVQCPEIPPPPCQPGTVNAGSPITQNTTPLETLAYDELHPGSGEKFTINTPNNPTDCPSPCELHIHLNNLILEQNATLEVTGIGSVIFHVSGTFRLGQGANFGILPIPSPTPPSSQTPDRGRSFWLAWIPLVVAEPVEAAPARTLTVTVGGTGSGVVTSSPGGINCPSACSASFQQNTVVTLTAAPNPGSVFAGWGGACTGTGGCSVTMNNNKTVSATFDLAPTPTPTPSPTPPPTPTPTPGPSAQLVRPASRVRILSCANDSAGTSSVEINQSSRISLMVFAPYANVNINQVGEFNGSIYGKSIQVDQDTHFALDPVTGSSSDCPLGICGPFQILRRWYDNPNP
jgi:hypothetical protein